VTLGTRVAQYISTCHWDDPCQIVLHLIYWIRRFKKKSPFCGGATSDPGH